MSYEKGCVYFHQGWTDIIICLGLINYYADRYKVLVVLMRSDSKDLIDFYVKDLKNVKILYIPSDYGRIYCQINTGLLLNNPVYINNSINIPNDYAILFHYSHDVYRNDKYKNISSKRPGEVSSFHEAFYKYYDIDYNHRINSFAFNRNLQLEEIAYEKFITKYSTDYVLLHYDTNNVRCGPCSKNTFINIPNKLPSCNYVNLNLLTTTFFDYIKIIINAKEIHLIDSIWGALIYQIDSKYKLFENIKIYFYPLRAHNHVCCPLLKNWTIINEH
jgi:hypothetical protein